MKKTIAPQAKKVLFLLEEQSAEEMLKKFLPRCFPTLSCTYRRFSGVNDLLNRLEKTIRNHVDTQCPIIILCDQDDKDCIERKEQVLKRCKKTGQQSRCIIRIACREWKVGIWHSWTLLRIVSAFPNCRIANSGTTIQITLPNQRKNSNGLPRDNIRKSKDRESWDSISILTLSDQPVSSILSMHCEGFRELCVDAEESDSSATLHTRLLDAVA
jgi:hypothetical protein